MSYSSYTRHCRTQGMVSYFSTLQRTLEVGRSRLHELYNDEDDDTTDDVTDQTPLNPNPSGDLPPPPSPTSPKGQDTASILAGLATDDVDNEPDVGVRIADNVAGDA